jgi:hypothetical protein
MVSAHVTTDAEHGGRWTSLQLDRREWLWRRDDPARHAVCPDDAFIDADVEASYHLTARPGYRFVWAAHALLDLSPDAALDIADGTLGGFPAGRPYRSIGVEPMLGAVFDLAHAGADDAVTVPPLGSVEWRLHITAELP